MALPYLPIFNEIHSLVENILSESNRYIMVEYDWKKIGWTIHENGKKVRIQTMLLAREPPYKRQIKQKVFLLNDPILLNKINAWARQIRGYD